MIPALSKGRQTWKRFSKYGFSMASTSTEIIPCCIRKGLIPISLVGTEESGSKPFEKSDTWFSVSRPILILNHKSYDIQSGV